MSFQGIIPAVTTPFDSAGEVDEAALRGNVQHLLDAGVGALVGTGTMGESGSLSRAERATVLETLCSAVDGRVPVIAGIAAQTPAVAVEYVADARQAGVAGFMVLPPLLYRGDRRELIAYFAAVADAAELPIIAYNNPQAAGFDIAADILIDIAAEVELVVQVKECSGDVRRIPEILNGSEGRLGVLVGGDDWAFEGLCAGAVGWISGVATVFPAACVELQGLVAEGRLGEARQLYGRLLPLARFDMTPKLVQYYKAGMDEVGQVGGVSRAPRLPLNDEEQGELRAAVAMVSKASVAG